VENIIVERVKAGIFCDDPCTLPYRLSERSSGCFSLELCMLQHPLIFAPRLVCMPHWPMGSFINDASKVKAILSSRVWGGARHPWFLGLERPLEWSDSFCLFLDFL